MKERMVRYTKNEIENIKGRTDHVCVQNTSDKEIEKQVENFPDSYIPTEDELKKFKRVHKEQQNKEPAKKSEQAIKRLAIQFEDALWTPGPSQTNHPVFEISIFF